MAHCAQFNTENVLAPFSSPSERRQVKLERKRLREELKRCRRASRYHVSLQESDRVEENLRQIRKRVTMSRPVRVESVFSLMLTLFCSNQWWEKRVINGCHGQCIPRHKARIHLRGGCWYRLNPRPERVYAFDAITASGGLFTIQLCDDCLDYMWNADKDDCAWGWFLRLFRHYDGRKIEDFLPLYVDYKRTSSAKEFSPGHSKRFDYLEREELEILSEDEDNGTEWEPFDGKVSMFGEEYKKDKTGTEDDKKDKTGTEDD